MQTAGSTLSELKKKSPELSTKEVLHLIKFRDKIDGVELVLAKWDHESEKYNMAGWSDEVDEQMMEAMYHAEQLSPFPAYIDEYDQFVADWKAKKYDPACAMSFEKADVEELLVLEVR